MRKYILLISVSLFVFSIQSVFGQVPTITGFSPSSGPVGTVVTITGTNFSATPASNVVYFGSVKAIPTAATTTQLTVTVPSGATFRPISVTIGGLTGYSAKPFNVTFSSVGIDANSFATKVDFLTNTGPLNVAVGDLDGDGKVDLAQPYNAGGSVISLFRNSSTVGTITASSLVAKSDVTTGPNPLNLAIGDLDGDGKLDMAVANWATNTVSVLRNISVSGTLTAASFSAKVDFTVAAGPWGVAIADLDGDGKNDLAVSTNTTLSILRNTSTVGTITSASFAAAVNFSATGSWSVAAADIDGDGKVDLAVSNNNTLVTVFRNTVSTVGTINSSSFATGVDFTVGSSPQNVVLGDLDGDGKNDMAVVNTTTNAISVFRNNAVSGVINSSTFLPKVDLPAPTSPQDLAMGDLDGDGKVDLAVVGNNTVSVLRNIGSSGSITLTSFASKVDFPSGTGPNGVAIADMDGDGKSDLVVSNSSATSVSILRNQMTMPPVITSFSPLSGPVGGTVFISGTNFNTTPANNIVYFGAAKATVTAATATQLTVTVPAGSTSQPITVTTNFQTGYSQKYFDVTFPASGVLDATSFSATVNFTSGSAPYRVLISDLNGDGKSDLVSINRDGNSVSFFKNNTLSAGAFTAASFTAGTDLVAGTTPYGGAIGDLDGDGKPDIVVTSSVQNTFTIFKNTSTASVISFVSTVSFPTGSNPFGVAVTDLDADGKPDIVIANKLDGTLSIFKNSISGSINSSSFATNFTLTTGTHPLNVAVGDLNGDGKPDLAVGNYVDNSVSVFRNTSTIGTLSQNSFDPRVDFTTGAGPEGIVLADLSGSGKLDIATSNQSENTVSVLKNNSAAVSAFTQSSFAGKVDFPNAIDPLSLAVGDLDGDAKLDLIDDGDNTISFIKNIGTAGSIAQNSFANNVDLTGTPWNIAIGDLDGDGKPEIVGAILGSNAIAVARNVAAVNFVKPTSRPSNLVFSSVTSTSYTASFTPAATSPTGYIVFRKIGGATTTAIPVDGTTYPANAVLGDGTVAYVGSAISFNETSLTAGSQYFYTIFPYNGSGTSISYLTTTPLTGSQLLPTSGSLAVEPTAQPTNLVFSGVTTTAFTVSFTAAIGNPDGYVLVNSLNAAPTGVPQDGQTYAQNQALTNGTGNIYDVGSTVSIGYGSSAGQVIFFAIYAYKGSGASRNFYTISPLTGNLTMQTGLGLAAEPTFAPSSLSFTSVTNTSYTVSYLAASGSPAGYIALRKAGSPPPVAVPLDYTAYTIGANIADATVAYVGSGLTFSETGLIPGTTYYYAIYSFNGSATTINYFTTTSLTGSVQTGFIQPRIISFSPTHGYYGSTVTITGTNFSPVAANDIVDFFGTVSTVISATPNAITTTVPYPAADGQITLTLPGGLSSTSILDFTVDTPPAPDITSFSPGSGFETATVTITGTDFFGSLQFPVVDFNGTVATVTAATDTTITTTVPVGALTGPINVTVFGQSVASTNDFTVLHMSITSAVSPTTYLKDGSASASITLNDLSSSPVVKFWTRGVTAKQTSAWQGRTITSSNSTFTATFSSSELADPIGFNYYFKAVGTLQDSVATDTTTAYLKIVTASSDTAMPTLLNGDQSNDYQIVSVPYILDNPSVEAVFNSLGSYDATRWRFFSYANASNTTNPYVEYPTVANVNVGSGYWLIMRNAATVNVGTGHTVNATFDSPFPIPLNSGHWTMIGNPYNFAVSWADIVTANPGMPSGIKFRTFANGTFSDGNKMKKYGGAFVFTPSPWTLLIPVTLNASAQSGRVGPTEKTNKSIDQPDWSVDLNLSNSEVSNNLGGIGMNPQAMLKGVDQFDEVSLPFPEGLGLSELVFRHPDLDVTLDKDIVPTASSYTWEFEVSQSSSEKVTLSWRNDYFGNSDNQLILFDPATLQTVDMRQKTSYIISDRTKKLKILFGSQSYIDNALDRELPMIGAVYPNPASQRVVIPFRVPLSLENADVNITIFDSQGRPLTTLVNGNYQKGKYEAIWLPEGSAGLYYLQFRLGTNDPESQKIVIIR